MRHFGVRFGQIGAPGVPPSENEIAHERRLRRTPSSLDEAPEDRGSGWRALSTFKRRKHGIRPAEISKLDRGAGRGQACTKIVGRGSEGGLGHRQGARGVTAVLPHGNI